MQNNKPKRISKEGGKSFLFLPEGYRPTWNGIKDYHKEYHENTERSDLRLTDKIKRAKGNFQSEINQRVNKAYDVNKANGLSFERALIGKELQKAHVLYNLKLAKEKKKPLTLAQFRTKAKRNSFKKHLLALSSHQF